MAKRKLFDDSSFTDSIKRAKRNLFGVIDASETDRWLHCKLDKIKQEQRSQWNFDFDAESPLHASPSSTYEWLCLPAAAVPGFYEPISTPTPKKANCSSWPCPAQSMNAAVTLPGSESPWRLLNNNSIRNASPLADVSQRLEFRAESNFEETPSGSSRSLSTKQTSQVSNPLKRQSHVTEFFPRKKRLVLLSSAKKLLEHAKLDRKMSSSPSKKAKLSHPVASPNQDFSPVLPSVKVSPSSRPPTTNTTTTVNKVLFAAR